MTFWRPLAYLGIFVCLAAAEDKPTPEQVEFFEQKIRPVLSKNCYMCHSRQAKSARGGLVVDNRDSIRQGGESGHAVVPGKPEDSLLLKAIRYGGTTKMPPMGKLSDTVIADFEKWIAMGAPDPRAGAAPVAYAKVDFDKARQLWQFSPPKAHPAPAVKNKAWAKSPIDKFVQAKQEAAGVAPVADADRRTLIRRASFDLTGLPPSPEEVEAFVSDKSKDAFAKVVDRMLESKAYGERWGRHWLDVARYAETMGRTRNQPFPVAWRYRDYVISAFNQDMPYDRFITEQLAGDLLPAPDTAERERLTVATGFLALGAHDLNEIDARMYEMDVIDEQVAATSKSFLGLTVNCARCHDHKFDPIPTRDYYAMAGIFRSTDLKNGLRRRPPLNQLYFYPEMLMRLDGKEAWPGKPPEEVAQIEKQYSEMSAQMANYRGPRNRPEAREMAVKIGTMPLPQNLAMGVKEASKPQDCQINIRGDAHSLGDKVPRGMLQVLTTDANPAPAIGPSDSGRMQLAQWITSNQNPLTARVMMNRTWQHLFGRGIVDTPDNFGLSGSKATHPELLDYLAIRFMEQGWSVKKMVREIMLTRTYQLSSAHSDRNWESEPDNKLLWRANRRRLEAEAIRDSMLAVSGQLQAAPPESSPVYKWRRFGEPARAAGQIERWDMTQNYRSVYVPVIRNAPSRFFETFDFPEPSEPRGKRDVTTVAPQALFLMNSPFVETQARVASERLIAKTKTDEERVRRVFQQVFSRDPNKTEIDRTLKFIRDTMGSVQESSEGQKQQEAWTRLYHALFASAEFRYRS